MSGLAPWPESVVPQHAIEPETQSSSRKAGKPNLNADEFWFVAGDTDERRQSSIVKNKTAASNYRTKLESRLQDLHTENVNVKKFATSVDPNADITIESEVQDVSDGTEKPLSDGDRSRFLVSLRDQWDMKPGDPILPEASKLALLLNRIVRSKVEEAMALFEAIVLTCPVNTRTKLLNNILRHVESGLPLEKWWETAGLGDASDPEEDTKAAFDNFVRFLENKWHLEHNGSRVDEAKKVYEQIKQLFYVSRAKMDEAMAFFETIAGGCDEDKRAELLCSILRQVKKGSSLEQWWASMSHGKDRREASNRSKPTKSPQTLSNAAAAGKRDSGSLTFITGFRPSDFRSKKDMITVRMNTMVSSFSSNERTPNQYTPKRKDIPTPLPAGTQNRDSGYFSERDASISRFATPQTLPSLTERSTISSRRMPSPWTPLEFGGPPPVTTSTLAPSHMEAIMEADDRVEFGSQNQRTEEYRQGLTWPGGLRNPDGSAMSRRKLQNLLAQQAFLARKKRLEDAKKEQEPNREEEKVVPKPETDPTSGNLNREVLMYQLPGEQVHIQCVCGNLNDGRFIIPCITCGRWQHIRCYYELAQDVVENHECVQCDPRELNGQGKVQAKRPAEEDLAVDAASTATQSAKRLKTMGAASSIAPSIKPLLPPHGKDSSMLLASKSNYQNILDGTSSVLGLSYPSTIATSLSASKSNYQNLLEGTTIPSVSYPTSLSTNLTSKRTSHKIAEQGRRNRINTALQEMDTLLPSTQKMSFQLVGETATSKAATVESAIEYIKELQQQIREKDWLLENKDRQLEQLWAQDFTYSEILSERSAGIHEASPAPDPGTVDSGFTEGFATAIDRHEAFVPHFPSTSWNTMYRTVHQDTSPAPLDLWQPSIFRSPKLEGWHDFNPNSHVATDTAVLQDLNLDSKQEEHEPLPVSDVVEALPEASTFIDCKADLITDWTTVQAKLPESWKWDVEYQPSHWTCTPLEVDEPKHYPLKIADAPVVLPVEHQWPPVGGVNPPPDPRPSSPIDCTASLPLEAVRDLFLTFENSIGFYLLVNDLLQVIVPDDFDTAWASSHLPHKYGGLKVCYISQTLQATMLTSATEISKPRPMLNAQNTGLSSIFRQSRQSTVSSHPVLRLNDFIEARPKANHRKEKYAGRIGLKVLKDGEPYLVMSTHIITEATLAKSHRETLFGRGRGRFDKLDDDWNEHVDIWAGNEKIGSIDRTFDKEAEVYPNGFHHDITLVKPSTPTSVKDIASPMSDLGWLSRDSWNSLRQQTSAVKILGSTEDHRAAKSIKCSRPSEILVVGEGIFLNQSASAGTSKSLKDHDTSTWKNLVSRALLYRVYPDFDPPNGHSGVALYADGTREDGSHGPGIVGFQSFVQRSGQVQNFNMEGPALEKRLQLGRIAFYGAFEVPEELKREYTIA